MALQDGVASRRRLERPRRVCCVEAAEIAAKNLGNRILGLYTYLAFALDSPYNILHKLYYLNLN